MVYSCEDDGIGLEEDVEYCIYCFFGVSTMVFLFVDFLLSCLWGVAYMRSCNINM
jgi:hypothetical protein